VLATAAGGAELGVGGDARFYQFVGVDEAIGARQDAELGIFRLKLDPRFSAELSAEAHGVVTVESPATAGPTAIVSGTTPRLFGLQDTVVDRDAVRTVLELDRLSLTWQRPTFRLVAGRQPITWGVDVFWPVLDLFAPFPPERIDREYKPGVDALRLTLPVGNLSEIDVVAAGQGTSIERDGSVGALARFHLGPTDVGAMAGWFHRDAVVGGFVTANVRGTGLRGEVAYTRSGDPADAHLGRASFWRAGVGLDRQLTPALSLSAELAWNGFGVDDPAAYPRVAAAARVQRGEVTSLGRYYGGVSLTWQVHPLVSVTGVALVNLGDGSGLLLPRLDWSLADSLGLVVGGIFGLGAGRTAAGTPGSEYGPTPATLYAGITAYF
jgi:hypothetical protein